MSSLNTTPQNNSNSISSYGLNTVSTSKQQLAMVKSKITIPMYFYNIIVPQLGSYYDLYPVDFDTKIVVCCPLHDEDTPSCRYYEETNSFYCFGCQKGGDVISLHRYFAEKMNGTKPEYDEAVAFLYQYFIQGKDTSNFIDVTKQKIGGNERLNTDKDIVKFNVYRVNLERSISFDNALSLDIKKQLWELLDNIDCLIDKNLMNVSDAEKTIKQKVKELITPSSYSVKMLPKGKQ